MELRIALYVNGKDITDAIYSGSFGVQHMPKKIKKLLGNKNIITNTYKIQAYKHIIQGKSLLDYTNFKK